MARPKGIPKSGGRVKGVPNKVTADVKALARVYVPDAIRTLAEIMAGPEQPAPARVAAAKELIDRGYGKSVQAVEMSGPDGAPIQSEARLDLSNLTLEQKRALASIKLPGVE